ncbi:hypothetical protein CNR22_23760 [Sphingobacteriaceae bacterium]|nr:hypothetical protein CNR22_23760 [Sphingobacteriaceae bacterium]
MILEKIKGFFKLVRWFHELVALIPFVGLYLVIKHFISITGQSCDLSLLNFSILCFAVQLLIATGCVHNDIRDRKIDKVNKPKTHTVENTISLKEAKWIFGFLTLLIILVSWYISTYMFSEWTLICIGVYGLSAVYNQWLKRTPLFGNILMAVLTAFIPLVILFFAKDCIELLHSNKLIRLIYLYALYPCLIIIPRELSLDISDMEGDKADGCKTLPLLIGAKKAKRVVYAFLYLILLVSLFFMVNYSYLRSTFIFTDLLLLVYMYKLKNTELRLHYIRIGRFLWLIMIVALVGFTIATMS